jgi:DNA-binding transcriptional regulator YdaS (Cro superfamily)
LKTSQKALIAARMSAECDADDDNPQICGLFTQVKAANVMGVSERSVQDAARVLRECSPEVIAEIERGAMSINAALEEIKSAKPKVVAPEEIDEPSAEEDVVIPANLEFSEPLEAEELDIPAPVAKKDKGSVPEKKPRQAKPSVTSSELSEEQLALLRGVWRTLGTDESVWVNPLVSLVKDMIEDFLEDKYRQQFLKSLKSLLDEYET